MAQYFRIHPQDPQGRLIERVAALVREGAVIVYPTDSSYALGCRIGDREAEQRVCRIRGLGDRHDFTLACRDLSQVATYARLGDRAYRLMRTLTPGPYTFVLEATREVPRRLQNPRRKTIGIRVPAHRIAQALLAALAEPLLTTTMRLPGEPLPLNEPEQIGARLGKLVDAVIDGGACGLEPTSVIDLTGEAPKVLRVGCGDLSMFAP